MLNQAVIILSLFINFNSPVHPKEEKTLNLDQVEILALRNFYFMRSQSEFHGLSEEGKSLLFIGNNFKDVHSIVITERGEWKWRTENNVCLCNEFSGGVMDYEIIENTLNLDSMSDLLIISKSHLKNGGSVIKKFDEYLRVIESGIRIMEYDEINSNQINEIKFILGEDLRQLPQRDLKKLNDAAGPKAEIKSWIKYYNSKESRTSTIQYR